jgi:hypothetical protein
VELEDTEITKTLARIYVVPPIPEAILEYEFS